MSPKVVAPPTPKYHPSHAEIPSKAPPRSELNTLNSFHDVIRLTLGSALVWYQCHHVKPVQSGLILKRRLHFTSPKYQGAQMLPHFVYVQSQRPRSEWNTLNSFHDVIRLTLGSALVWYQCHHVKPVQSGLILKRRLHFTSPKYQGAQMLPHFVYVQSQRPRSEWNTLNSFHDVIRLTLGSALVWYQCHHVKPVQSGLILKRRLHFTSPKYQGAQMLPHFVYVQSQRPRSEWKTLNSFHDVIRLTLGSALVWYQCHHVKPVQSGLILKRRLHFTSPKYQGAQMLPHFVYVQSQRPRSEWNTLNSFHDVIRLTLGSALVWYQCHHVKPVQSGLILKRRLHFTSPKYQGAQMLPHFVYVQSQRPRSEWNTLNSFHDVIRLTLGSALVWYQCHHVKPVQSGLILKRRLHFTSPKYQGAQMLPHFVYVQSQRPRSEWNTLNSFHDVIRLTLGSALVWYQCHHVKPVQSGLILKRRLHFTSPKYQGAQMLPHFVYVQSQRPRSEWNTLNSFHDVIRLTLGSALVWYQCHHVKPVQSGLILKRRLHFTSPKYQGAQMLPHFVYVQSQRPRSEWNTLNSFHDVIRLTLGSALVWYQCHHVKPVQSGLILKRRLHFTSPKYQGAQMLPHFVYVQSQRPRSEWNTLNSFHDVIRLTLGSALVWYQCHHVKPVQSGLILKRRLHFTSPKYQGAQMLPHFVYVQSQRPRSEWNTLNSFHDVIRLTLGSALVWYQCHHVKPVQSGLILKRRLHFTSPKYQGAQMLPHFVYVQSQRPRSEWNTLNSFHDVIRLTLGSALVWYQCHHVKPVQSGLILKRRLHFTSPKYQGAQMLPHFVYVQSQRPRSEWNTLNSFHDVIRLTLGSALVWYQCHHVKPVQSGLILKRRLHFTSPKYQGAQMLPHFVYVQSQRPRSELNTLNSFHDVIRLSLARKAGCKKRTRVIWADSSCPYPESSWNVSEFPQAFQVELEVLQVAKVALPQCMFANSPTRPFSCRVFVVSKAAIFTRPNRQIMPQIHLPKHGTPR